MAEPKKSSDKTKGSARQATAKPKAEVIDGAAVEKPAAAGSVPSSDTAATSKNQTSTDQHRRRSTMVASQSVALVIAGIAVVVALLALAVSVVTYRQTADLVVSDQLEPSPVKKTADQADLAQLHQRLDNLAALISRNANDYASLQQQLANTTAAKGADMPAPSSLADPAETDGSNKTSLDDVIARLAALEATGANQNVTPALPDGSAEQDGFDKTQIGLLAAAGLLAENLAGRHLDIWVGVFDALQWPGIDPADRDIISMAAQAPVAARADLLSLGRLQLAPMVQSLNKAEDGSGLLEQARARLANLIQLRRTGGGSDQPETVLASFETALDNADFDAAFAAATLWSSAGLDGLEPWLAAAQRRHDLDRAVNRLVAIFVQHAAGQS